MATKILPFQLLFKKCEYGKISALFFQSTNRSFSTFLSTIFQTKKSCILWTNTSNFHHTPRKYGLEEFFDNPKNFGKLKIKSGMAWTKDLLRRKSTEDLQKLWFILLKERNMLNTLELHCISNDEPMPGADRLEKVAESMSNLRDVIDEREHAINMLTHGTPDKIGGEWRRNELGLVYFYKYQEHLLPKELNKDLKADQPADIASFDPKLEELHLRFAERGIKKRAGFYSLLRIKYGHIRKRNPHLPKKMPKWFEDKFQPEWLYGIHPRLSIFMKHKDRDPRILTTPFKH